MRASSAILFVTLLAVLVAAFAVIVIGVPGVPHLFAVGYLAICGAGALISYAVCVAEEEAARNS